MTAIQIETTAVQHEAIFQPETTTFASQLVEEPVANTSSDPGPSGSFEGLVVSTLSNPGPSVVAAEMKNVAVDDVTSSRRVLVNSFPVKWIVSVNINEIVSSCHQG
ncbi:unnamed protein product [Arctia plantaginis]|uniref:Uncharacterized protein n=2 Tax=Arctia plantaginis TaxID=874455 RepID=A0A8S1AQX7_ARCPL|nr:unnamed protein product [Arctia plantaginis]